MYVIEKPEVEPRLQERYQLLVKQHLRCASSVAPGLRVLPSDGSKNAASRAASRFYQNDAVALTKLSAPLLTRAKGAVAAGCHRYALCVHDQSPLHFTDHKAKIDRKVMCNRDDWGYELQSALMLSDRDGEPLAPCYIGLAAADGVHSTRRETPLPLRPWVDEVNRTMGYCEAQQFDKELVHIIDRELDKLLHLRRFARCDRLVLIRANDVRRVYHEGESRLLSEVEQSLSGQFKFSRRIKFQGKKAWQYVAETTVSLNQPARLFRQRQGKLVQRSIPGKPLTMRLIIAQVRDKQGKVLATWRLWTNLPSSVKTETVALWYYWRWRIESFHKLLKRAGQHVEQWQQTTALRVARRLLVAAQACVIIWALMQASDEELHPLRHLLIRLSGRMMEPGEDYTAPALLAGIWSLLAMNDALNDYSVEEIRQLANLVLTMLGDEQEDGEES